MPKIVVNVTYSTLEQAETEVFRLIESKTNYRDICQIEFNINGIKKKFSLSQISKIKQKLSPKNDSNLLETKTESEQKAMLFELFQNKMTVIDVIIKTKLNSKLVNDSFLEYVKLSNVYIVEKKFVDNIEQKLHPINRQYGIEIGAYNNPETVLECASEFLTITD